jgi:hypothetical protein
MERSDITLGDHRVRHLEQGSPVIALRLQLALTVVRFLMMAHVVDRHGDERADAMQEADVALAVRPFARRPESDQPRRSERRGKRQQARRVLAEPAERRDHVRVVASLAKTVYDDGSMSHCEGGQMRSVKRPDCDGLNPRPRSGLGIFAGHPIQLRTCPRVVRKHNAQQVEIDNRTKTDRQVREEFFNVSVTSDQFDRTE